MFIGESQNNEIERFIGTLNEQCVRALPVYMLVEVSGGFRRYGETQQCKEELWQMKS